MEHTLKRKDCLFLMGCREVRVNKCPICGGALFNLRTVEIKNGEVQRLMGKYRVVYQCVKCGYWSDWFDCLRWHPPEELFESAE